MSFKIIKGQESVIERFRNAVKNDRLAGAYIFAGLEGVGKLLFARELAKFLLCKDADGDSCDTCPSCKKVASGNHPDLTILQTAESEKDIKIKYVRALQEQLYLKPLEGDKKVFIVNDAHKLNEASSNCFLKSFEEPPSDSIIILITHNLSRILPTIQSRAAIVHFRSIGDKIIEEILVGDKGLAREDASFITMIAGGSLSKALALTESDFQEKKAWIRANIFAVRKNNNFDLAESLRGLCSSARGVRQQMRQSVLEMLDMMLLFFRWLLSAHAGKAERAGSAGGLFGEGSKILSQRAVEKVIIELVKSDRYIASNANISLTLENMFYRIGEIEEGDRCQKAISSVTAE